MVIMKPVVAYQVHLMSQMRNSAGRAKGLKLLGVDPSEVDTANAMVADVGLSFREGNNGSLREADVVPRFLGAPRRITPAPVEDSAFWTTRMFYSLPVWRELELELSFNTWGHLGNARFVRAGASGACLKRLKDGLRFAPAAKSRARRLRSMDVVPWRVVEDDISLSCSEAITVEWFGYMTDYCCTLLEPGSAPYFWAFDFGLLQKVEPWDELPIDEEEIAASGVPPFRAKPWSAGQLEPPRKEEI
ncbi:MULTISPECIES: hypothetical protein [Sorangium]|uniref:hypothetical protein n=1 Tax=Sorangium TaxID=39643 RepID=UPI003D9C6630